METAKILVLAPKINVWEEIKRVFIGYDVTVDYAEAPIQAVSLLAKYPYFGMIVEENLPGVSGMEFSKRVKEKLQNLIVLLLVRKDQVEERRRAITSTHVDHVVVFPWRLEEAKIALHEIFPVQPLHLISEEGGERQGDRYVLQESEGQGHLDPDVVKVVIKGIEDLPPLPDVVRKILGLVDDTDASAKDLAQIITSEPSLTAKILKITNSSFYGFRQQVTTISHAVVILGFNEVKNLVLGYSIFSNILGEKEKKNEQELNFWRHNIACGVAARILGEETGYRNPEELFVIGLLHDIGKTVFHSYFTERYREAIDGSVREHIPLFQMEKDLLGLTHADVGYWLARLWNLPVLIRDGIRFHHTPLLAKKSTSSFAPKLVPIINYADILSKLLGIGDGGDSFVPGLLLPESMMSVGMEKIGALCDAIISQVKLFEQSLGIFDERRWEQGPLLQIRRRRMLIIDDGEEISPLEVILGVRRVAYKRLPFSKDVFLDMMSRDTDILLLNLRDDAIYPKFMERLLFENPTPPPVIAFTQEPKISDPGRHIYYLRRPYNIKEFWRGLETLVSPEAG